MIIAALATLTQGVKSYGGALGGGGGGYALSGGYGGGAYGGGAYGGGAYGGGGYGSYGGHAVNLAVKSHHNVQYYDVPSHGYVHPVNIEVGAQAIPVNMIFHSQSSHLNVKQHHENQGGSVCI